MRQNAYVSLGSNLGDRAGFLLLAVRGMLAAGLDVIRLSSIYETQPVEYTEQPMFLNLVAELRGSTLPTPEQTLARLLRIEFALGRTRNIRLGACDGRTDRCQESRLIDASHFYFHRTGRLTALLPTHFDLAMRVTFKDRRATHGVNGNPSTPGDKADDLFPG